MVNYTHMKNDTFRTYAVAAINLWIWTSLTKIIFPRIDATIGPIAAALIALLIATVFLFVQNREGEFLSNTRGAVIYFGIAVMAFILSFIAYDPSSESTLVGIIAVLLSVGLAVLNGFVVREVKLFLRVLGIGLMVTALAIIATVPIS